MMFMCTVETSFQLEKPAESLKSVVVCSHENKTDLESMQNHTLWKATRNVTLFHCDSCGRCTVIKPRVQENRQHTQPPSLWSSGVK